jgi:hypothetical protein
MCSGYHGVPALSRVFHKKIFFLIKRHKFAFWQSVFPARRVGPRTIAHAPSPAVPSARSSQFSGLSLKKSSKPGAQMQKMWYPKK